MVEIKGLRNLRLRYLGKVSDFLCLKSIMKHLLFFKHCYKIARRKANFLK